MKNKYSQFGFTLIELMVVIVIVDSTYLVVDSMDYDANQPVYS